MKLKRMCLSLLYVLATLGVAYAGPVTYNGTPFTEVADDEMDDTKDMLSLAMVLGSMNNKYVDEIPKKDLFKLVMEGALSKLDAHSSYMDPEAFKQFNADMQQEYAGIGVIVSRPVGQNKPGLWVNEIYQGGPADKAGIQRGDIIKSVNGIELNQGLAKNIKIVRGLPGSKAQLVVMRNDRALTLDSSRGNVPSASVFGSLCECGGLNAYFMRVSGFRYSTGRDAAKMLMHASTLKPKSIIIDLRDNPGGSLPASVELASLFLKDNTTVVSSRERGKPERFMGSFTAVAMNNTSVVQDPLDPEFIKIRNDLNTAWPELAVLPVYIMVNSESASAAEIVAAALKDNTRALVVGEPTFGKGSVQTITPLPNGGALRLTIARYYTPSGKSVQALGVQPDEEVLDARPWRLEAMAKNKARYMAKSPKSFTREADLPRHLSDKKASVDIDETLVDEPPREPEPYERRFSYAPMGSDGRPDGLTAKTLELAKAKRLPNKRR